MKPIKRILVPLDFSPVTETILEAAEQIAAREQSRLLLLHVLEPFDSLRQRPPVILTSVLDNYARLVRLIPPEHIESLVIEGNPIECILNTAVHHGCHAIIMGHGGRGDQAGHVASAIQKLFRGNLKLVNQSTANVV